MAASDLHNYLYTYLSGKSYASASDLNTFIKRFLAGSRAPSELGRNLKPTRNTIKSWKSHCLDALDHPDCPDPTAADTLPADPAIPKTTNKNRNGRDDRRLSFISNDDARYRLDRQLDEADANGDYRAFATLFAHKKDVSPGLKVPDMILQANIGFLGAGGLDNLLDAITKRLPILAEHYEALPPEARRFLRPPSDMSEHQHVESEESDAALRAPSLSPPSRPEEEGDASEDAQQVPVGPDADSSHVPGVGRDVAAPADPDTEPESDGSERDG